MIAALLLLMLAAPEAAPVEVVPPPPFDPEDRCGRGDWIHHYLDISPTLARQGTTIAL